MECAGFEHSKAADLTLYCTSMNGQYQKFKRNVHRKRRDYVLDSYHLGSTTESEEELKRLLMKVKVESEKVGLKLNIQKMKIMASGPITSWEIDGETVETVSDFVF